MTIYKHDLVICPWCDGQSGHRVDHLYDRNLPTSFGPWYCDACQKAFLGTVIAPGEVEVRRDEANNHSFTRSMALLKLDTVNGPIFFVMDHKRYRSVEVETDEDNQGHQRYFFEEHSCPTNWLRECVAVIKNGDPDPHGVLSFMRAVDVPEDFDEDDDSQWPTLFPEAFEGNNPNGRQ